MIKKTRHATTNYRKIKPYLDTANEHRGHHRFTSTGYMDFVVENLGYTDYAGRDVYSLSHYGEQNGDLMADPDMEIAVDEIAGTITPRTFRNDYMGLYQEVFKTIGGKLMFSQRLLTSLDDFLWRWMQNIEDQGFLPV